MEINRDNKKRVFLAVDSLTQWDGRVYQRFPSPEKVEIYGLEPGPAGSWDSGLTTIWGTAIKENNIFRMWYWGQTETPSYDVAPDLPFVCYAESEDGIHWTKPALGITGKNRYPGNNLLTLPGCCMGVVRALPQTNAKYLMALIRYNVPLVPDVTDVAENIIDKPGGTYIYASDDGLRWRMVTKVFTHGDWACLYADRETNRYLLYNKVGAMHGLVSRRSAIVVQSEDGIHWEGYKGVRKWHECFVPDDYDDLVAKQLGGLISEYYGVGIYRCGEILISVEDMFVVWPPLRQSFSQNPNGLCYFRLGFSHDGIIWRHPQGRPIWLSLGNPGDFDAGFMVPSSTFVEHNDELFLYYGGSRYDHGWSINPDFSYNRDVPLVDHRNTATIMMAKIKKDRFASLASTYKGYFDIDAGDTRPGNFLYINAACRNSDSSIRVAIAEKQGPYHGAVRKSESLPGFSFDDCVPINTDSVRAQVRFKNARISDIPAKTALTLRFELNKAEIFGYEWDNE
ncbi:MAG: hypothetical protein NC831_01125 [Candidatus Omnitrophica bacterium]|nr:hypothetical protein [Candidatus Omnitrophota bacterium]